MTTLSVGVYRHLTQCASADGKFVILALDHRGNLLTDLQKHHASVSYPDVVAFKTTVLRHLAPLATAALIDPDYGLPALTEGAIPGSIGLLAPLEVTDYTPHPSRRATNFIPYWDVSKLKLAGFSGAKLLLYYHPEAPNAYLQINLVDKIVEQCQAQQVPLFLEPISYSLDTERPLSSAEKCEIVIETARQFSLRGVDVLKLEFPLDVTQDPDENVWKAALAELNAVCKVPWTLLSAGVAFSTFLRQAELACAAGASGVIAGRAIWAEAVALHGDEREKFLATTASERMKQLTAACSTGTAWTAHHTLPMIGEGWYID